MTQNPVEVVEVHDSGMGFSGYLCVNTLSRGIAFGGCRFDLSVTKEDVLQLAQCMTWKLAVHGLPVGGCKGGLRVNPQSENLQPALKLFSEAAARNLRTRCVLGKDLGATNEIIDQMYANIGIHQLGLLRPMPGSGRVPDKLRDLTGYRPHMTGYGVAWACKSALRGEVRGVRAVVQGAGAVGIGTAFRLSEMGAQITGISDVRCAIYREGGFSMEQLFRLISHGRINEDEARKEGAEVWAPDRLLAASCDLLILAASSNSVRPEHTAGIKAQVIAEGSNFGLTPEARELLFKKGALVIPDILASSASSAMVAYQLASLNQLSDKELWQKILSAIDAGVTRTLEVAKAEGADLRSAYIHEVFPQYLKLVS